MLAYENRITRGSDYKAVVRRGRRVSRAIVIVSVRRSDREGPARFGFIVGRVVGNAVMRNRVRRRLKAICHSLLASVPDGTDIVIRALPAAANATWDSLLSETSHAIDKGLVRS